MTQPPIPAELLDRLSDATAVITPTDDGRNENYRYSRAAAARLAIALNVGLVLYDRESETWVDTPHNERACTRDGAERLGADHLVKQFDEMKDLGVRDVTGFLPSLPTFSGLDDALRETGANVIVAPATDDHPKLAERITIPDGDIIARLQEFADRAAIVLANPDGSLELKS